MSDIINMEDLQEFVFECHTRHIEKTDRYEWSLQTTFDQGTETIDIDIKSQSFNSKYGMMKNLMWFCDHHNLLNVELY